MPFDISGALGAGHTPDAIVAYLQQNPKAVPNFDVAGALAAGHDASSVVDFLNPHQSGIFGGSSQGIPLLAPVARGVARAQQGAANLAGDLGFSGLASSIRSRIDQEDLAAPSSGQSLSSDLAAGHVGAALGDLPSAALEQTLPVAAGIASGAVTGGAAPAAGIIARLFGGAATGAVTSGDAIARQRAANNGDAAPTASDLALGIAGGAGVGAAGSVGLGGVGSGLGAAAMATGKHILADAAQPEAAALDGSVGTTKGTQNASGSDLAAAALTGLATRGAMAAPDALGALPAVTPGGRAAALADRYAALAPDAQQQAGDVAAAGATLRAAQSGGLSPADAARSAILDSGNQVRALSDALHGQGVIDGDGKATIAQAMAAASDPRRSLTADHLGAVDGLQLDPDTAAALGATLRRTDLLSQVGNDGSTGPFQTIARAAGGPVTGAAIGALTGGHVGAEVGGIVGAAMKPAVADRLGSVGARVDDALGLGDPQLVKDARSTTAMLTASGLPVPDTQASMLTAIGANRDVLAQQRAWMAQMGQAQDEATAINRNFDQTSAAQASADRAAYQTMLREAYSTNQQASQIDAAHQQMTSALASRSNTADTAGNWLERQLVAKFKAANPMVPVTGAGAIGATTPEAVFQATGGRYGNPAGDAPNMSGMSAPGGAGQAQGGPQTTPGPQPAPVQAGPQPGIAAPTAPPGPSQAQMPTPGPMPAQGQPQAPLTPSPMAAAQARSAVAAALPGGGQSGAQPAPRAVDPIQAAVARSQIQAVLQGSKRPAVDLSGLVPAAQAQAAPLPEWVWQHGKNLEDALVASGQAKPVNMMGEAVRSLDSLKAKGLLPADVAEGLKGHQGRVAWPIYNLVRQETLLRHGIDRTAPQQ